MAFIENPLADNLIILVKETIDSLKSQVGHAQGVGIGVNKRNVNLTSPILENGALFSGEFSPGLLKRLPIHLTLGWIWNPTESPVGFIISPIGRNIELCMIGHPSWYN
jgi:hypothetical protein